MSNLNAWDPWFKGRTKGGPPPEDSSYVAAEKHLAGLDVEDWGCAFAAFRDVHNGGYKGVDGTVTPEVDEHVDLVKYKSKSPGILLRHVLEHNHDWPEIVKNANESFTEKLVIVFYLPLSEETKVVKEHNAPIMVPELVFNIEDVKALLTDCDLETEEHGKETLLIATRKKKPAAKKASTNRKAPAKKKAAAKKSTAKKKSTVKKAKPVEPDEE